MPQYLHSHSGSTSWSFATKIVRMYMNYNINHHSHKKCQIIASTINLLALHKKLNPKDKVNSLITHILPCSNNLQDQCHKYQNSNFTPSKDKTHWQQARNTKYIIKIQWFARIYHSRIKLSQVFLLLWLHKHPFRIHSLSIFNTRIEHFHF